MKQPKIGVIGLAGQSAFLRTEHLPAPGESVHCSGLFFELGGKGYNQAIACARTGAKTVFVGAVGDDAYGRACEEELKQEGIIPCLVRKDLPTAFAAITTAADGENTVAVFPGAAKALQPEDLYLPAVKEQLEGCSLLLLQNELEGECLREAIRFAGERKIPVILNPAPAAGLPGDVLADCALITPNYGEALLLAGLPENAIPSQQQLAEAVARLGPAEAVVTMGRKGAMIVSGGAWEIVPAVSFGPAVDTTGAGDTFNGVLAAALAAGRPLKAAVELAAVAAGLCVTCPGAKGSIPRRGEQAMPLLL